MLQRRKSSTENVFCVWVACITPQGNEFPQSQSILRSAWKVGRSAGHTNHTNWHEREIGVDCYVTSESISNTDSSLRVSWEFNEWTASCIQGLIQPDFESPFWYNHNVLGHIGLLLESFLHQAAQLSCHYYLILKLKVHLLLNYLQCLPYCTVEDSRFFYTF